MATRTEAYDPYAIPTRRMSLEDLLKAAAHFGVEASGRDIEALRAAVRKAGEARFSEENREASDAWNRWYEKNGHPLGDLLQF